MLRSQLDPERKEIAAALPGTAETVETAAKIRVRVRFDYRGLPRPARFFFGGKGSREVAEDLRQKQAAMWRNVPLQGVRIEDIEYLELYQVFEESEEGLITYAPVEIKVTVDTLEDCLRFVNRDEFRRIEILEPSRITLSNHDLERIFFKVGETIRQRLAAKQEQK